MAGTNIQAAVSNFIAVSVKSSENISKTQTEGSNGSSFSSVMDKTSKQSFKVEKETKKATENVEGSINDEIKKSQNFTKKLKEADEINEKASLEQNGIAVVMVQVIGELKEQIATELGITVEELNSIMEEMNVEDYQLFDTETLGDIVLTANNLNQPQDLLINSEASTKFKNIMAVMENAGRELADSGIEITEEGFVEVATGEKLDKLIADEEPETDMDKEEIQSLGDTQISESPQPENQTDMSQESGMNESEKNEKKQTSVKDMRTDVNDSVSSFKLNPLENLEQILTQRVGKNQSESILNQLVEQIKINVNGEFKSMEMQLYPEHLGKVGVQVAVKDGVLTAQISAETEAVKKVLEAQISTLKESFNNQGLKVENVEVTIASHSFEQNNMSNSDGQAETKKDRKSRKVDASLINEINGITEEDVADEAKTMETLGNTVSYSA